MGRLLISAVAVAGLALAAPAQAADKKGEFRPKPETYLCPNVNGVGVDCFLDAVEHLYTMCRQVKSIEILEFGYEKSEDGVNGAKSEYCIDKHKATIAGPFKAALKEASGSRAALDALRSLHELWLGALLDLKWKAPESDDEYKGRVSRPYEIFRERASLVRAALSQAHTAKAPAPAAAPHGKTKSVARAH